MIMLELLFGILALIVIGGLWYTIKDLYREFGNNIVWAIPTIIGCWLVGHFIIGLLR